MAKISARGATETKRFRTTEPSGSFTEVLFRSDQAILRRHAFRSSVGNRMESGRWSRWLPAERLGQAETERRLVADPNRKWVRR